MKNDNNNDNNGLDNTDLIHALLQVDDQLSTLCNQMMFWAAKTDKLDSCHARNWAFDLSKARVSLDGPTQYLIDEQTSNPTWDNVKELPPTEG